MRLRRSLMLGGAACLLLTAMPVLAQEAEGAPPAGDVVGPGVAGEVDPFAPDTGGPLAPHASQQVRPERAKEIRKTMRLRTEVWEVASMELVRALDAGTSPELIKGWRHGLLEGGTLISAPVLVLDTGCRASAESCTEQIYPTEYEGGGLNTPVAPKAPSSPVEQLVDLAGKFTIPTSFETRNTGTTVEATLLTVTAEEGTWDVLYSLEDVRLDGFAEFGDPALQVKEPTFTSFRATGLIRIPEGQWQIASCQPAPVGAKDGAAGKSWVTLIRIDRAR